VVHAVDDQWNLSPAVVRMLDRRLLDEKDNPLNLVKRRLVDHIYQVPLVPVADSCLQTYRKPASGSPLFTVCENQPRVVSTWQNFDSLLTPADHISRRPSDTYYINRSQCLR
jgi:phenylalanyl-tRNA synthetase alpha chain